MLDAGKNPDESLPNDKFHIGYMPLMWGTNRRYSKIVRALLEAGADVNATATDKSKLVMLTCDGGSESLETLVIRCVFRADITKKDWRGQNLIHEGELGGK